MSKLISFLSTFFSFKWSWELCSVGLWKRNFIFFRIYFHQQMGIIFFFQLFFCNLIKLKWKYTQAIEGLANIHRFIQNGIAGHLKACDANGTHTHTHITHIKYHICSSLFLYTSVCGTSIAFIPLSSFISIPFLVYSWLFLVFFFSR